MDVPNELHELVERFDRNLHIYKSDDYNETQAGAPASPCGYAVLAFITSYVPEDPPETEVDAAPGAIVGRNW